MKKQIALLKPDKKQPRKTFDKEKLQFLAESILSNGLLKPIIIDEKNTIIDGERRWRAHKLAKLKTAECQVIKLGGNGAKRLRHQLVVDIQDEEIPTGERYEAIVKLYKIEDSPSRVQFAKGLGISDETVDSAFKYCNYKQEEPEIVKSVSPHIIIETASLPKEERKKVLEEFKGTKDKKKDLIRELVKAKKKVLKDQEEIEKLRAERSKREVRMITDRERLWQIRDEIISTRRQFQKLMVNVKWMRKKKFYFMKPRDKDNFLKFLDATAQGTRNWADELDDLKENISLEILKE